MSRDLILIACYVFTAWLLWRDCAWRKAGSWTLLLPGAWLAIQGSRPLSYWFGGGGGEGHPINTLSFGLFLVLGFIVLSRRGLVAGLLPQQNRAVFLIYGYFFLSVLWSDMPLSSLKRIVKDFETVLIALVFLVQPRPAEAIRIVYTRVAYLLFPLSIVFIKFYPDIGRAVTRAGDNMFTGVTIQKNSLGMMVFVLSLMIIWDLWELLKQPHRPGRGLQVLIRAGMIAMAAWLLSTCDSQTSILCLFLGVITFWGAGLLVRSGMGKGSVVVILIAVIVGWMLDKTFGLTDALIRAMGRDPTMTGRTEIWSEVLAQQSQQLTGYGFCIFWDTRAGRAVIESLAQINSAHNGYLEMYIDGGLIGIVLLAGLLFRAGSRVLDRLFGGHPLGAMGLVFWLLTIVYNFSESSFFRLDVLWFTFLLMVLECTWRDPEAEPGAGYHDDVAT